MAIFDKLKNAFSKKKEAPAPQPAPKEWPRSEEPSPDTLTAEQAIRIARSREPANEFTLPSLRMLLSYAIKTVPTLETLTLLGPGRRLMEDNSIPADEFLKILGGLFREMEQTLKVTRLEKIRENWLKADRDTLLNGLKALSHFAETTQNTPSIKACRDALAEHLRPQLTEADLEAAQAQEVLNKIATLQLKYAAAARNDAKDPKLKEIAQEICMNLRMIDAIYVAYDEDFNPRWPFMATDGRPEIFTYEPLAHAARDQFLKMHDGRFRVVKIEKEKLPEFWQSLSRLGIGLFRLNNGRNPVELKVEDVQRKKPGAVIDDANAGMRNMMLRELQYGYRLRKMDESQKGTPREQLLQQLILTMRANGFRELGLGLTYVLGPKGSGGLQFTPKALEQAKKLLAALGLDESHLAPEGVERSVYEGPITLRVANKPGMPGIRNAQLCVFTEYAQAAEVCSRFSEAGCEDAVIVVTFEEMFAQAQQCAGIVLDMPTLGMEIPKSAYMQIQQFRSIPGPIVINFKKDESKN